MVRRSSAVLGIAVALVGGSWCAKQCRDEPSRSETSSGVVTTGAEMTMNDCPLAVPGAKVSIADVGRGVAVTIRGPAHRVEEERERAQRMRARAGATGGMGACACPMSGEAGAAMGMQRVLMSMPVSDLSVADVEGGVRLLITAVNPDDTAAVRELTREQADRVKGGRCAKT